MVLHRLWWGFCTAVVGFLSEVARVTSYLNGRPLGLDQILMNVVVKVCERTLVKMAPLDGLCLILVSCNILRMTFSDIPFLLDWGAFAWERGPYCRIRAICSCLRALFVGS